MLGSFSSEILFDEAKRKTLAWFNARRNDPSLAKRACHDCGRLCTPVKGRQLFGCFCRDGIMSPKLRHDEKPRRWE